MEEFDPEVQKWLLHVIGAPFKADKHIHSHQDEVYKIIGPTSRYYLKISASLESECVNLQRIESYINVPRVIDFFKGADKDYLLISEIPGKNLVELIGESPDVEIVTRFAEAIRKLHSVDVSPIFPGADSNDVVVHGDMALPNIIISEQGVIGYIDLGQMSYGLPDLDLADAIWSLQRNLGPDYGHLFLEKYGLNTMTPKIKTALSLRYHPPDHQSI